MGLQLHPALQRISDTTRHITAKRNLGSGPRRVAARLLDRRFAWERSRAVQGFVERHAVRKLIARRADVSPEKLLGRHVPGGSDHGVRSGHAP